MPSNASSQSVTASSESSQGLALPMWWIIVAFLVGLIVALIIKEHLMPSDLPQLPED